MRIHYFQHDHFEDLGYIGNWAMKNNIETTKTRFDLGELPPKDHSYDWLVILGGKMSVYDQSEFPWLHNEIEFIQEAISLGKIVIGICLGSQLVAKAAGAEVFKNKEPEMGFWPVKFTGDAVKDVVFRHFPAELTVLHLHFDTFSLPIGALKMAFSEATSCQAFRIRENIFAFQFHFEVTPENIDGFIKEVEPELVTGNYSQSPSEMLALAGCCAENNQIFNNILNEIQMISQKTSADISLT